MASFMQRKNVNCSLTNALPYGEGGPKGRERCGTMFRLSACFSKFVLHKSLFRRGCRRATFPKGEGLSHRQTTI